MSDTWKRLEGEIVNGKFPLRQYLGGSEQSAVFLTERLKGEILVKAAIKLTLAGIENGELQFSRWQEAAKLSHPHLISLYELGRFELDGISLVYVVMECADENLAQILSSRALTPAETRAMLESVLDILGYLHREGFAHGHIRPANIMASGDQLKVSSEGLRRVGESPVGSVYQTAYDPPEYSLGVAPASQAISPAGDVWSLGMTLVETLTRSLPVVPTAEHLDPQIPRSLQQPFLEIARHCLLRRPEGRWTVAQIVARLEDNSPVPPTHARSLQTYPPASAPLRISPESRPSARLYGYAAPIAIGFALLLAVILAGPRLFRHRTAALQVPISEGEQPPAPAAPSEVAPSLQEHPTGTHNTSVAEEERPSKAPTPMPALVHPQTIHEEETNTVARLSAGTPAHGGVAHQVMPEVLQSAADTIRGTVRVRVKVDVDRSGNVEEAELESSGPSKYFARAALAAAQLWKFKPPMVGGKGVLSTWSLQFEFTRYEIMVVPLQKMP
jgi:TonB family protein